MSTQKNVQIVKNFLAALGRRDKQDLLALSAEDIEWIIPGEDWPPPASLQLRLTVVDVQRDSGPDMQQN